MNRRKLVEGSVSSWFECEEHGWTFGEEDEDDNCPVCFGEKLAEARIIKLLEEHDPETVYDEWFCRADGCKLNVPEGVINYDSEIWLTHLIALIKEKQE